MDTRTKNELRVQMARNYQLLSHDNYNTSPLMSSAQQQTRPHKPGDPRAQVHVNEGRDGSPPTLNVILPVMIGILIYLEYDLKYPV